MKIIFDTNLYISAFVFDRAILDLVSEKLDQGLVYVSQSILNEILDKFNNGRVAKISKNFDKNRAQEFLNILQNQIILVEFVKKKVALCRDPNDNKFLELALEVRADFLITGDKDLLAIKQFENTKILKPSQFMTEFNLTL